MNRPARPGLLALRPTPSLPALAAAGGKPLGLASAPPHGAAFTEAPRLTRRAGPGEVAATPPDGTATHTRPSASTAATVRHRPRGAGRTAVGCSPLRRRRLDQRQDKVPPVGTLTQLFREVS